MTAEPGKAPRSAGAEPAACAGSQVRPAAPPPPHPRRGMPKPAESQPHPARHPHQNRSEIAAGASRPSLDQARHDEENNTQIVRADNPSAAPDKEMTESGRRLSRLSNVDRACQATHDYAAGQHPLFGMAECWGPGSCGRVTRVLEPGRLRARRPVTGRFAQGQACGADIVAAMAGVDGCAPLPG
jgi:hypothetical protein